MFGLFFCLLLCLFGAFFKSPRPTICQTTKHCTKLPFSRAVAPHSGLFGKVVEVLLNSLVKSRFEGPLGQIKGCCCCCGGVVVVVVLLLWWCCCCGGVVVVVLLLLLLWWCCCCCGGVCGGGGVGGCACCCLCFCCCCGTRHSLVFAIDFVGGRSGWGWFTGVFFGMASSSCSYIKHLLHIVHLLNLCMLSIDVCVLLCTWISQKRSEENGQR